MRLAEQVDALDAGALFSPCRRWRYLLWRRWDPGLGVCAFIGLNPSTADETVDDPTVRRCIRFARDWGYGSLHMLNLFALRATDPRVMIASGYTAIGPRNSEYILNTARVANFVVAAWGNHGLFLGRQRNVADTLEHAGVRLHCLGVTKAGAPKHPLYLAASSQPVLVLPGAFQSAGS